jgi:hypothetical protein
VGGTGLFIGKVTGEILLAFKHRIFEMMVASSQVKVTLRLMVSQSVCLGVKPNLGLLTRDDFPPPQLLSCLFGAHSLMRVRVCHLSVFVNTVYSGRSIFT